MATTYSQIVEWVATLKSWEQAAFSKVISTQSLTDQDYEELISLFLQDAGLEATLIETRNVVIQAEPAAAIQAERPPVQLLRIFNLESVNALPAGQVLTFGPQLTVIYGGNGSGKTGYSRVLACAAFARGKRSILPNVAMSAPAAAPSADIEIRDGESTRTIRFVHGVPCKELSSFYVFDSESVHVHLVDENALAFDPAGLNFFAQLVVITDTVRERLRVRIRSYRTSLDVSQRYVGESAVSKLVANINHSFDLAKAEKLAVVSSEDDARKSRIEQELTTAKAKNIDAQLCKLKQEAIDVRSLERKLTEIHSRLDDAAFARIHEVADVWRRTKDEASRAGSDQFLSTSFSHVGSDEWKNFIETSRHLAVLESSQENPYPHEGDVCLLCRQPLSAEALSLIKSLWSFLASDAQTRFASANSARIQLLTTYQNLDLSLFGETDPARRTLSTDSRSLAAAVLITVRHLKARHRRTVALLGGGSVEGKPVPLEQHSNDLEAAAKVRDKNAADLELLRKDEHIRKLENSLRELVHRQLLADDLPRIRTYVAGCKWANVVESNLGTSDAITRKQSALFKLLVADKYLETFSSILASFNRPLKVSLSVKGDKAHSVRRIVLSGAASPSRVDAVLSDGEKRAVAISDFLAEVSVDSNSSGILLDDPVTSLDAEWKDSLANLLANEATRRQVIIFTHDLPFLYSLLKSAEVAGAAVESHWVERRGEEQTPGYVFLHNSPVSEHQYKDASIAHDYYAKAAKAAPGEAESLLKSGFGALRTSYEVFVAAKLLGGVVRRFEERINMTNLKALSWDESIVKGAIERYEQICCFIEGHSHSDAFASTKPTPKDLLTEINAFDALRKEHKDRKQKAPVKGAPAEATPADPLS
jgi:hypothetical protein